MSGKGDKQRPADWKKYTDNYDRIFGKKENKETMQEIYAIGESSIDFSGPQDAFERVSSKSEEIFGKKESGKNKEATLEEVCEYFDKKSKRCG